MPRACDPQNIEIDILETALQSSDGDRRAVPCKQSKPSPSNRAFFAHGVRVRISILLNDRVRSVAQQGDANLAVRKSRASKIFGNHRVCIDRALTLTQFRIKFSA